MELDKSFSPEFLEKKWYETWERNGFFREDTEGDKESFCIQLPPPNVTGTLHMGHAFQQTLMDILVRYHRMKGFNTNWIVGTDHAGIATQIVVERQLESLNISKHEIGREAFLKKVWQWKKKSGSTITNQMRRIGASANWSYADSEKLGAGYFTMDKRMSESVTNVFIKLYEEGLIYRGKRLVNWDPTLQTAVSDLEVESQEEKGKIWEIKYQVSNSEEFLTVATTRPETLLGDTAVAVSPSDQRYQKLVGKTAIVPITNRLVPIIADDYVEPEFGSGCVKITPAHDFNDYEVGLRHQLDSINIFTPHGTLNKNCPGRLEGLSREEARLEVLKELENENVLVSEKPHLLKIPRSGRTGCVVEPMLTNQWFVKTASLADAAKKAVEKGDIEFVPGNWANTYYHWLDNIRDWCISRQLWWGHQIPAWHGKDGNFVVAQNEEEARLKAKAQGITGDLSRDPDVLDTWFSSALVPFTSLGWPRKTRDLELFLPSNVLITGFDIIFFWVARMIMMSLKFTKKIPFKKVYINALVRDADGNKMSKSKGNTLDPIDLIDGINMTDLLAKSTEGLLKTQHKEKIEGYIKKNFPSGIKPYGADALRFTFTSLANFSRTLNFDLKRCEGYRNFCNKLWNATRFVLIQCDNQDNGLKPHSAEECKPGGYLNFSYADKWIVTKLHQTINEMEDNYDKYRFDLIASALYRLVWDEYCDWYLEIAKSQIANGDLAQCRATRRTLLRVLETILRLSHPIIPFITEELWQKVAPLAGRPGDSIVISEYPKFKKEMIDTQAVTAIQTFKDIVVGCRKIKADLKLGPDKRVPLLIEGEIKIINMWKNHIIHLAKVSDVIHVSQTDSKYDRSPVSIIGNFKIMLELEIDVDLERNRLKKLLNTHNEDIRKLEQKLSNQNFVEKAPELVVKKEKDRLESLRKKVDKLGIQIRSLPE